MMAQEPRFRPGQLVWAKMKGYPYWPGKVQDESEVPDMRRPKKPKSICVKFFGSGDMYAYMDIETVRPYFRCRGEYMNANKKKDFIQAVEKAEHYVVMNPEVQNFESDDDDSTAETKKAVSPVGSGRTGSGKVSNAKDASGSRPSHSKESKTLADIVRGLKREASPTESPQESTAPKRRLPSPTSAGVSKQEELRNKKIGFIGLGTIGSRLVRRLIAHGFHLTIYDRSFHEKVKTKEFQEFSQVPTATSPAALMQECDIVFDCVYDSDAAREVVFGSNGVVDAVGPGKSYIELTTVDPQTAIEIFESISAHGGRFLEAPLSGLRKDAEDGRLVFLCAGDKSLFDECGACFEALGRRAVFFGDAGTGAKFRLLHQMLAAVMISSVSEIAAIAYRCGLSIFDLNDVFGDGSPMGCSLIQQTLKDILEGVFEPSQQLGQMQRELQLALNFTGYELVQPTMVASAANQVFLQARRGGEEMNDSSAIYRILTDSMSAPEGGPASMAAPDNEK